MMIIHDQLIVEAPFQNVKKLQFGSTFWPEKDGSSKRRYIRVLSTKKQIMLPVKRKKINEESCVFRKWVEHFFNYIIPNKETMAKVFGAKNLTTKMIYVW